MDIKKTFIKQKQRMIKLLCLFITSSSYCPRGPEQNNALRAEWTEQNNALRAELAELTEQNNALRAELTEQNNALRAELAEQNNALRAELAEQNNALRATRDELTSENACVKALHLAMAQYDDELLEQRRWAEFMAEEPMAGPSPEEQNMIRELLIPTDLRKAHELERHINEHQARIDDIHHSMNHKCMLELETASRAATELLEKQRYNLYLYRTVSEEASQAETALAMMQTESDALKHQLKQVETKRNQHISTGLADLRENRLELAWQSPITALDPGQALVSHSSSTPQALCKDSRGIDKPRGIGWVATELQALRKTEIGLRKDLADDKLSKELWMHHKKQVEACAAGREAAEEAHTEIIEEGLIELASLHTVAAAALEHSQALCDLSRAHQKQKTDCDSLKQQLSQALEQQKISERVLVLAYQKCKREIMSSEEFLAEEENAAREHESMVLSLKPQIPDACKRVNAFIDVCQRVEHEFKSESLQLTAHKGGSRVGGSSASGYQSKSGRAR